MQPVMSSDISSCTSSHVLQLQPLPYQTKSTQADEINSVCPRVRFDSLTLDELSEELDRRKKETQRLQDELENATKITLERFGCMYNNLGSPDSPGQGGYIHHFMESDNSSTDCAVHSTPSSKGTQPRTSSVDGLRPGLHRGTGATGEEVFDNVKEDSLQPHTGSQHNKVHHQPVEETFCLDTAINKLHAELHKVQTKKDVLSDLRLKDSRERVSQVENMLSVCQELHHIKRARDQKLSLQQEEASALNGRVEGLEKNIKRLFFSLLPQVNQHGDNAVCSPNAVSGYKKLSHVATLPEDTRTRTDGPSESPFLAAEKLGNDSCCEEVKQNQRMKALITSLGQEMALLMDKLTSSEISSVSLSHKVELLKEAAEKQTLLHQLHVSKLLSALSTCNDKVCCLEQQLFQAQTQLVDIEGEKEQLLRKAAELHSRLPRVEEDKRAMSEKLRATRKQLCREEEEKTSLQTLLKQREQEDLKFHELLGKKNKEVRLMQQQNQQHHARLEEVQRQREKLHADKEALSLRLVEREKQIDGLRSQVENSTHMAEQHRQSIDKLRRENNILSNQLDQRKQEIQQLVADLKQHKSDAAVAERERTRLQATVTDHLRRLEEEQENKQQITVQLELLRTKLLNLRNEHMQLQKRHVCVKEEHQGVVQNLRGQLKNAHFELEQVRASLRALEGAGGHGLQTAMDMQEKVTARREEIDTLQSKIQQLEDTGEELRQENSHQGAELQQQLLQLGLAKKEKRQLKDELEALRSKDKQFRNRIKQLEAILHKLLVSFADCQDFLELQDQEFYRLKLQHALDLKEPPAQNVSKTLNVSLLSLAPPSALGAPLTPQRVSDSPITQKKQHDQTVQELRSLVKELREVISENLRPHTLHNAAEGSFCRRRSAPERVHRTTFRTEEAHAEKAAPRSRRRVLGSEPQPLKTVEPSGEPINSRPLSEDQLKPKPAAKFNSSLHPVSPGHKSPVYALLTSDPNS